MSGTLAGYEGFLEKIDAATPVAFILGCDRSHGLAFTRSLGRRRIPVVTLGAAGSPGMRSRYGLRIHVPPRSADPELLELFDGLGRRLHARGVLLPTDDAYVLFVSRNRSALSRHFDFVVPDPLTLEKLASKRLQYEYARSLGIPVPRTYALDPAGSIEDVADAVGFPCVIKPAYSHLWRQYRSQAGVRGLDKLAEASSRRELIEYHDLMSESGIELIVQEIIEGDVDQLYALYAYVNARSEPLALFVRRKLRQWPVFNGNGCYSTGAREPAVLDLGLELLQKARYQGLANIEFKKDPKDGRLKLIEFNPRSASQVALAVDSGVDIPFIAYSDSARRRVTPVDTYRDDVKWIDLGQDVGSFLTQYRKRQLGLLEWIRSVLAARSHAYFATDDLRPAVGRAAELLRHWVTPRRSRAKRTATRTAMLGWLALGAPMTGTACGESGDRSGGPARDGDTNYPSRSIEIVSWATPGGHTDLLARALARAAPGHFEGRRLTVVTRQGGGGAATMQYLTGRAGDGHVLAVFTASGAVNMATGRIPFGPADFTPLLRIQLDPFLVAVREDSPYGDLVAFFDAARARPGRLSVSGFGAASAHFLGFAALSAAADNPDVRWIAYGGSGDAVVAALGGHTDAVHTNYHTVREHLRAGTMRVLGVSLPVGALAGTPTYAQQGFEVAPVHWRGVVGPPDLDPDLAADIRARLLSTVHDSDFGRYMREAGAEYAVMEDAESFGRWMASEVETSRELLERLGLLDRDPG